MANYIATMLLSLTLYASILCLGHSKVHIGVCYGRIADNHPSPNEVVNLYQKHGIEKMRIFQPYPHVLEALRGSHIRLILGTLNNHVPVIASSEEEANSWFTTHVRPYVNDVDIEYISVGNEVIPREFSESILPAMQNLQKVLEKNNHTMKIRTTTVVDARVLETSNPPSEGQFSQGSNPVMSEIIKFLSSQKTPILVNLYPYYAYAEDWKTTKSIQLDYALLSPNATAIRYGNLTYSNLLDAMLDAFYHAMEKEGVTDVDIVVSESGWPHDGNGNITTKALAQAYNNNLILRVNKSVGTPMRPGTKIEGYIFAMLDENLKKDGSHEPHWGLLFTHNMKPNYEVRFGSATFIHTNNLFTLFCVLFVLCISSV